MSAEVTIGGSYTHPLRSDAIDPCYAVNSSVELLGLMRCLNNLTLSQKDILNHEGGYAKIHQDLNARIYPHLDLQYQVIDDETHLSGHSLALTRGLHKHFIAMSWLRDYQVADHSVRKRQQIFLIVY